ncbi:hypothetical protein ES319_D09G197400v1 [Gossypium barbadense]|uniref:Uncharacterized protein n=1 Tax=Gossypium barbadense TaxID=3634 RepID=A0A5J5Q633_GOSBA|nr:hypothetical protein ES319_D09G197400v1 [Gossypium barbadense]
MASLVSIFLLLFTCSFSNFSAESRKELKDKEDIHLRHLVQSNVIDPSRVMQLSWRPRVVQYSGFLMDEECDLLISLKEFWGSMMIELLLRHAGSLQVQKLC